MAQLSNKILKLGVCFGAINLMSQTPLTIPEQTNYQRTSTVGEVKIFMERLEGPLLQRYQPPRAPNKTEHDQPLLAWRLKTPDRSKRKIRVYINANIHAGEVEGKESVQLLVREFVKGMHPKILPYLDLVIFPCYNAEGTDLLDPKNRPHQPNPASGVGTRENIDGLDLNRDLMKATTYNTRWFLWMLQDFNPHVVIDLHTTNGSYHGFHLTYSPALSPQASSLKRINEAILTEARNALEIQGMPTYDYGNFQIQPNGDMIWHTFEWFPRYLSNFPALQNRIGILSEAYVYRSYSDRINETLKFVLATLDSIVNHQKVILENALKGEPIPSTLPLNGATVPREQSTFEIIEPIKDSSGKLIGEQSRKKISLPSYVTFEFSQPSWVPEGYLISSSKREELQERLAMFGIKSMQVSSKKYEDARWMFDVLSTKEATRPYQGIKSLQLTGSWKRSTKKTQSNDSLWVPLTKKNFRLVFYLLDPMSPDGLVYWRIIEPNQIQAIATKRRQRPSLLTPESKPAYSLNQGSRKE